MDNKFNFITNMNSEERMSLICKIAQLDNTPINDWGYMGDGYFNNNIYGSKYRIFATEEDAQDYIDTTDDSLFDGEVEELKCGKKYFAVTIDASKNRTQWT